MPAQNNEKKKNFNPTITRVFPNDAFGNGSYLSQSIDAEGFKNIQQHLQIGSKLLLKKSPVKAKNTGAEYFFLEILPPYEGNNKTRTSANASADSDV